MKRVYFIIYYIGLLSISLVCTSKASNISPDEGFTDRVNLALRHAGHQLLNLAGDLQSTIPPVEMETPNKFRLNLNHVIEYDSLPGYINQAFLFYNIDRDYHVVVESCEDEQVLLGYNFTSFTEGAVACRGREQNADCSNIVVTFKEPPVSVQSGIDSLFLGMLLFLVFGAFGYFLWRSKRKSSLKLEETVPVTINKESESPNVIQTLGNFQFDHKNQSLQLDEVKHNLTFRESKLLHQLALHINEIQTRDTLIDEVWGDEGVIVGRSLDVFISRLRKLLKADDSVVIKTIHGVGYRLELAV